MKRLTTILKIKILKTSKKENLKKLKFKTVNSKNKIDKL